MVRARVEVETKSGTRSFHGMLNCAQRYFQRHHVSTKQRSAHKDDFGVHHRGLVSDSRALQQGPQQDFLLLGPGVAPGASPSQSRQCDRALAGGARRRFQRRLPAFHGLSRRSCDWPAVSGNIVPVDDVNRAALIAQIPAPTQGLDTWNASPTLPTTWREELVVSIIISPEGYRASHTTRGTSFIPLRCGTNGTSFPTIQTNFGGPGVSLVTRLTATVTPTLLNEFVFSYTTDHITDLRWSVRRPAAMTFGILRGAGSRARYRASA